MKIIIEEIVKSINIAAIIGFIFTLYKNIQKVELEKKIFWYRECVVKPIISYLEELEIELEDFLEKKRQRNEMKKIKGKIYILRRKVKVLTIFLNEGEKTGKRIDKHIENMENKMFNTLVSMSKEEIIKYSNEIRKEIYLYEKNGYAEKKSKGIFSKITG